MLDVIYLIFLDVDYRLRITRIVHQQLWGYTVEEKIYLEVRKRKKLNMIGIGDWLGPTAGLNGCVKSRPHQD